MEKLIQKLTELDEIKVVKRFGGPVLKIQLFMREIEGSDAVDIHGDLQSISQKIMRELDNSKKHGEIKRWNWTQRPEKQYQETNLGYNSSVTDRKAKGHKPGYYQVSVEE